MIKDAYPVLTKRVLKREFVTDNSNARSALTILKLLESGEIYFAPGAVVHGMMVDGLGVFESNVGYPGKLTRLVDEPGLMVKLDGGSLTGFRYNLDEEKYVVGQVNEMLTELGWTMLLVL